MNTDGKLTMDVERPSVAVFVELILTNYQETGRLGQLSRYALHRCFGAPAITSISIKRSSGTAGLK